MIAGGAMIAGALAFAASGLISSNTSDTAATTTVSTFPPAPQNLRAYEVGPTHVKVSYGPAIVGPFQTVSAAPDGRSVKIAWGATTDALYPTGPFYYEYRKNGKIVWTGRNQTYANVGITLAVRSFKVCVTPHSPNGWGPKRCTTFNGR